MRREELGLGSWFFDEDDALSDDNSTVSDEGFATEFEDGVTAEGRDGHRSSIFIGISGPGRL